MRNLTRIIITIFCLCVLLPQSHAATKTKSKAIQPEKERLVLMPLRVGADIQPMLGAMETALAQGLQQQYTVFAGEDVAKKTRDIFKKESAKKNCDETRCMEDIAIAFQSELIATANVTKIDGGYLLALSIRNVMDNKSVYNNSLPCKGCDAFQVVDRLKELSGATAAVATIMHTVEMPTRKVNQDDPETVLWNEVQATNIIDDYQAYLTQYPKGKFSSLAKSNTKKLQEEAANEISRNEEPVWQSAEQTASEFDYQNYLKLYPKGRYTGLAKMRINKLQYEQVMWQKVQSSEYDRVNNGFDHQKFKFVLIGRHADVKCKICHKNVRFKETPKDCILCHKKDFNFASSKISNRHKGMTDSSCESCHNESDWKIVKQSMSPPPKAEDKIQSPIRLSNNRSPGDLTKAHASFEDDCDKCHKKFERLAQAGLCKACHAKVKNEIFNKTGIHGQSDVDKECKTCHTEHKGRDAKIIPVSSLLPKVLAPSSPIKGHTHSNKKEAASKSCGDCHEKDDTHNGDFGPQCQRCHVGEKWREIKLGN